MNKTDPDLNRQRIRYLLWWRRERWWPPAWFVPWGSVLVGLDLLELLR